MNLEARARAVVDERLFAAYWASVEHFGTTDLVLYFDTEREEDPVDAFVRARLLADPSIPPPLAAKISKPAKGAATVLSASEEVRVDADKAGLGSAAIPVPRADHVGQACRCAHERRVARRGPMRCWPACRHHETSPTTTSRRW
jgi:hypothetical protein